MKKVFQLSSEIVEVKALDDNDGEPTELFVSGYASTMDKDRVGDVILPDAWSKGGMKNFDKNPILLFNHNYDKPIGRVSEYSVDDKGLKIKGKISKSAGDVFELVREGILKTFSVGFMIKDADYDKLNDGLVIKSAELLEVSVVTVPCNQDATFSVAKSFENQDEYLEFRKQFENDPVVIEPTGNNQEEPGDTGSEGAEPKGLNMDKEELSKLISDAVAASNKARDDAAAEEANKVANEKAETERVAKIAAAVVSESEERIYNELTKRFADEKTTLEEKVGDLTNELKEKSAEITAIVNSKRVFSDRNDQSNNWKKEYSNEVENTFLLARITGKGYDTDFAKSVLEKVNAHSSVTVSSADFEQEVSTNIERDIELELILKPLFREVQMTSATMLLPIMPDVGYAEVTSAAGSTTGVSPNGTLDERGGSDRAGAALDEIELRTIKMVAKSYLGNETEEDAILPVLPLLRESMVRQHARGVENLILLAGHADGAYSGLTSGAQGLLKYASTNSRSVATGTVATLPALTGAALLDLRKRMGKYGLRATDIVYIVSMQGYFELLEDAEFQDFNLVNNQATKLTGEVGQIYGSSVMVCDEFPTAAADKFYALALNKRNFLVPRLRGITVESDYSVEDQHRVLVTTQRLGFRELIPNAKSVFGLAYPAAS